MKQLMKPKQAGIRAILLVMILMLTACQGGAGSNMPGSGSADSPSGNGQQSQQQEGDAKPPAEHQEQGGAASNTDGSDHEETGDPSKESGEADPALAAAAAQLSEMTDKEKIGQLVMVGIEGTRMDDVARKMLDAYHVGGFIFFKDNIESTSQAVSLLNELKKANASNPVPLWLSIDEEGGRVTRFPEDYVKLPSSGKVGSGNDPDVTRQVGELIGQKVNSIGINMVYAPVLDVNSNPDNPVIGDRSFGETAEEVGRQGIASMKGIQEAGVVPVVKHFPGHGDTSVDSHLGLPVVTHDIKRLQELEIAPFRKAIEEGADVVMVGHLLMTAIDKNTPSSYSKAVITDLLRQELGFDGVVITDDMTMGAITKNIDAGEAAVQSILAGTNIVMIGHDYALEEAVIQAITEAVNSGVISGEVLDERVLATLALKQRYHLKDEPADIPDIERLNEDTRAVLKEIK